MCFTKQLPSLMNFPVLWSDSSDEGTASVGGGITLWTDVSGTDKWEFHYKTNFFCEHDAPEADTEPIPLNKDDLSQCQTSTKNNVGEAEANRLILNDMLDFPRLKVDIRKLQGTAVSEEFDISQESVLLENLELCESYCLSHPDTFAFMVHTSYHICFLLFDFYKET